jgi:SpoVK/Ycf46/Vps4 family AAA+-type ATPase
MAKSQLTTYIRASTPLMYVVTPEEARAELEILTAVEESKRDLIVWSATEGIHYVTQDNWDHEVVDPIKAIKGFVNQVKDKNDPLRETVIVMKDFHSFFKNPLILRHLRDAFRYFGGARCCLFVVSPVNQIPPELERDFVIHEFKLPDKPAIKKVWDSMYKKAKKKIGAIDDDEHERIIQAALGLTTTETEFALAKAMIDRSDMDGDEEKPLISQMVLDLKAEQVKKSGILEFWKADETADDIGGLNVLKKWMGLRKKAFTKAARDFGIPLPRGILLVGLPGCGKSLVAKVASKIFNVPLIRFDIGKIFAGLVGQSEQNMRTALQQIDALGNCIVWVDEMEKAFAGMTGGGSNDSGVGSRVFGSFITWMQEKKNPSFIVATVNRIEGLPPELMRKGRFDEIFFVGLPDKDERSEILDIHIRRRGRDPKKIITSARKQLVDKSDKFSGAELEEAVTSGLYTAFDLGTELDEHHILSAIQNTNAQSKTHAEAMKGMAKWAKDNAVDASREKAKGGVGAKAKASATRDVDLG